MPAQYDAPAWGGSLYQDLVIPSGATILAKRLDFTDIVAAGLMNEFDSLSPVVTEKVTDPAAGRTPQDRKPKKLTKAQLAAAEVTAVKDVMQNAGQLTELVKILALILPIVVIKPQIQSTLVRNDKGESVEMNPADRKDGVIYVDTIPLADRMFILSWSMEGMDMSKLESFREQPESPVGDVEPLPKPAFATE